MFLDLMSVFPSRHVRVPGNGVHSVLQCRRLVHIHILREILCDRQVSLGILSFSEEPDVSNEGPIRLWWFGIQLTLDGG